MRSFRELKSHSEHHDPVRIADPTWLQANKVSSIVGYIVASRRFRGFVHIFADSTLEHALHHCAGLVGIATEILRQSSAGSSEYRPGPVCHRFFRCLFSNVPADVFHRLQRFTRPLLPQFLLLTDRVLDRILGGGIYQKWIMA